jgi:hypothetical protein
MICIITFKNILEPLLIIISFKKLYNALIKRLIMISTINKKLINVNILKRKIKHNNNIMC